MSQQNEEQTEQVDENEGAETPPVLTEEDEEILDSIWDEIGAETAEEE